MSDAPFARLLLGLLLHCALSLAAQCIVIGPVCGGRAVSAPYYSQRARSVCVSLSAFFISLRFCHSAVDC